MQAAQERILEKLEVQALEDESLGQDWYDEQVSRLESWLSLASGQSVNNMSKRFFAGHPHPLYVEQENARLQVLKRDLNDRLFIRLNHASKGPIYQMYKRISVLLNDPHYESGLFYREEHFPAKAEDLIARMLQEVKAYYEESLRFLEDDREAYENEREGSSLRRDIFRELAGSFSENVQRHGSMSMESGLGRESGYSYSVQSAIHEVPREIRDSQDFNALYKWAKAYYEQAIIFACC